jgi:N-acetylglucosaminyldiphosphoundecaprenol N-acetyl-beta-D-mannosaminyltransferase
MNSILDESSNRVFWKKVLLLGVKIDALSLEGLLFEIQSFILKDRKAIISYVNAHAMNIAYSTPWFRKFLNQSDVTFCDGVGIRLAAKLTGQRLNYRYTPPDFMDYICEGAIKFDWKLFFLGAKLGVAQRAADRLTNRHPGLQIETHHGYFDKHVGSSENKLVVRQINQYRPQILVLGFGMPLQERWILDNMSNLDINIVLPAGALFDYLSGEIPRAPRWMTDNGLEWLGRLLIEPRRLWKRYIFGNPLFFLRVVVHHFLGLSLPE